MGLTGCPEKSVNKYQSKDKGEALPLQAWTGLEDG
jgi:hypothetical protein